MFTGCRVLGADSFCNSVRDGPDMGPASRGLCGRERWDRLAVMGCGRGGLEVAENGTALEAAGLAGAADPFDPAVAFLRLGAELDLSEQHAVSQGALSGVVCGADSRDFAEGPERVVFIQQPGAEPAGLEMPATDALFQERLDLLADRLKPGVEPVEVMVVLEIFAVSGDHLTGGLEKLVSEPARRTVALGEADELANGVAPAQLLLEHVE